MGNVSLLSAPLISLLLLISLSQIMCLIDSSPDPCAVQPSRLALKTSKKHFVLVHGAGHGAWSWYKLIAMLETAGHSVSTVDLAGCGISPKRLDEVSSLQDYVKPLMELMESIPESERVVLVSHSLGGLAACLAMEAFAEKISVGVFVAATVVPPNSTLHEIYSQPAGGSSGCTYDTKFSFDQGPDHGPTSVMFGPQMLAHRLYQNSPLEDLKLATVLYRETRVFTKENTKDATFTIERYGSVPRVYAICGDDNLFDKESQSSMMAKAGLDEEDVIEGADHMAMLSKPEELLSYLVRVSGKYA